MENIIVTKSQLTACVRSLSLAKTGFELMDKKRNILMHELLGQMDVAKSIQGEIAIVFAEAYKSLENANISFGLIESIADSVDIDNGVFIKPKSIIGIEVPIVTHEKAPLSIPYGLNESNSSVDSAYLDFLKVKDLCVRLAEVENTIYRLASAIKKVKNRANALKNITIPKLEDTIRYIQSSLEEKEREDFTRLKKIKR